MEGDWDSGGGGTVQMANSRTVEQDSEDGAGDLDVGCRPQEKDEDSLHEGHNEAMEADSCLDLLEGAGWDHGMVDVPAELHRLVG